MASTSSKERSTINFNPIFTKVVEFFTHQTKKPPCSHQIKTSPLAGAGKTPFLPAKLNEVRVEHREYQ